MDSLLIIIFKVSISVSVSVSEGIEMSGYLRLRRRRPLQDTHWDYVHHMDHAPYLSERLFWPESSNLLFLHDQHQ
jgi:hypothetical protein